MSNRITFVSLTYFWLACIIICTSSCSTRSDEILPIKVNDRANIIGDKLEEQMLIEYPFPKGIPVLIETVTQIPDYELGNFAQKSMDSSSYWKSLGIGNKALDNGIYILVSEKPRLIQIRYGRNIILEAYRSGLAGGKIYRTFQEGFQKLEYDSGIEYVLRELSSSMPSALDIPWLARLEKPALKLLFSEYADFVIPSDGAYNNFVFRPYTKLLHYTKALISPWLFVVMNSLLLLLITYIGKEIISFVIRQKKIKIIFLTIWSITSGILLSVPYFGVVILLGSMRTEDLLFLNYLGISTEYILPNLEWMNKETSWWIALIYGVFMVPFVLVEAYITSYVLAKLFAGSEDEREIMSEFEQTQTAIADNLNQLIGRAIKNGVFILFMPLSISLLIIGNKILQIPKLVKRAITVANFEKKHNKH